MPPTLFGNRDDDDSDDSDDIGGWNKWMIEKRDILT